MVWKETSSCSRVSPPKSSADPRPVLLRLSHTFSAVSFPGPFSPPHPLLPHTLPGTMHDPSGNQTSVNQPFPLFIA